MEDLIKSTEEVNEMENVESEVIMDSLKPGPVDEGISSKAMITEAQQNIIADETELGPVRLPGNRKNRRKLAQTMKIPKEFILKCTKQEADKYTKENYNFHPDAVEFTRAGM